MTWSMPTDDEMRTIIGCAANTPYQPATFIYGDRYKNVSHDLIHVIDTIGPMIAGSLHFKRLCAVSVESLGLVDFSVLTPRVIEIALDLVESCRSERLTALRDSLTAAREGQAPARIESPNASRQYLNWAIQSYGRAVASGEMYQEGLISYEEHCQVYGDELTRAIMFSALAVVYLRDSAYVNEFAKQLTEVLMYDLNVPGGVYACLAH
jgi:hypothetical protein